MKSIIWKSSVIRASLKTGSAIAWLMAAGAACAQTPESSTTRKASSASTEQEIIVTGTLIRGIAPAGASPINIGRSDIAATGATTTSQLLANIPQMGGFNSLPAVSGGAGAAAVNRVNLRNLPGTGGGSSTLLLVDGHRMPGMGIIQTIPDPDAIPPGAIERVEVVPDGGSSTYGADAVGGVVNFITRRRFNGLEMDGRLGIASGITTRDANITAGKAWDQFSVWGTYNYESHDSLYGRDRSYVQRRDYVNNQPLDLTCSPGNIVAGSTTYALPGLTPGNGNRCDISKDRTFYPSEVRHSLMGGISYGNGGAITADLRGFYTNRLNISDLGPSTGSVVISPSSPYYQSVGGTNATASQTVYYNFGNLLPTSTNARIRLETWQISPSMTAKLGKDWQVRALATYGQGVNSLRSNSVNSGALQGLVSSGVFNPYNPGATGNQAYYASITNYGEIGYGRNEQADLKVTLDGPLFMAPGGAARLALGGEYLYEKYTGGDYSGSFSTIPALGSAHRHVSAAFGEVQIPLVGPDNRFTAVQSLSLSLSGRYDHYSDFGGTFNPRVGVTYKPVEWVSLRGSWSKSFQAPSLADSQTAASSSIITIPFVVFPSPNVAAKPGQAQIFLGGGGANLRPQTADIYSFGGDIKVPFLEGLKLGATYYNIRFKDLIGIPPVFAPSTFYSLYPQLYTLNPTAAQVRSFASQAAGGTAAVAGYTLSDGQVYSIIDGRRTNQSAVNTSGVDFNASYSTDTGFGSVFASINGNYILSRDEQTVAGAPIVNTVDLYGRLSLATTIGAAIDNFKIRATWNRAGSYQVAPTAATLNQSEVKAFNLVNLFLSYDFKQEGALKNVTAQLNVNNIFDTNPPVYRQGDGYVSGAITLGRYFVLGLSKKF